MAGEDPLIAQYSSLSWSWAMRGVGSRHCYDMNIAISSSPGLPQSWRPLRHTLPGVERRRRIAPCEHRQKGIAWAVKYQTPDQVVEDTMLYTIASERFLWRTLCWYPRCRIVQGWHHRRRVAKRRVHSTKVTKLYRWDLYHSVMATAPAASVGSFPA
jgi:hypothetical protein